jgi:hypothetical protein
MHEHSYKRGNRALEICATEGVHPSSWVQIGSKTHHPQADAIERAFAKVRGGVLSGEIIASLKVEEATFPVGSGLKEKGMPLLKPLRYTLSNEFHSFKET